MPKNLRVTFRFDHVRILPILGPGQAVVHALGDTLATNVGNAPAGKQPRTARWRPAVHQDATAALKLSPGDGAGGPTKADPVVSHRQIANFAGVMLGIPPHTAVTCDC